MPTARRLCLRNSLRVALDIVRYIPDGQTWLQSSGSTMSKKHERCVNLISNHKLNICFRSIMLKKYEGCVNTLPNLDEVRRRRMGHSQYCSARPMHSGCWWSWDGIVRGDVAAVIAHWSGARSAGAVGWTGDCGALRDSECGDALEQAGRSGLFRGVPFVAEFQVGQMPCAGN